jgi:hypothetical protein
MKARNILVTLALTAFMAMAPAPQAAVLPAGVDAAAAFERLKALEGAWETASADGKKATTTFELTANGTVLLERYANAAMPGGGHMVTAYHLDRTSLILTHYCVAKNQPRCGPNVSIRWPEKSSSSSSAHRISPTRTSDTCVVLCTNWTTRTTSRRRGNSFRMGRRP